MRSVFARFVGFAGLAGLGAFGCRPSAGACVPMGPPSALVLGAAVLRLDLYDGPLSCVGARPPLALPPPSFSRTFTPGQKLSVEAPAGRHLLVVTAFADAQATVALGQACREVQFDSGGAQCVDLALSPAPDLGVSDGASPDLAGLELGAADLRAVDASGADLNASDFASTDLCSPVVHQNGLGQSFTDCVPLGTHNLAQANKAAMVSTLGGTIFANTCGAVPNQTANVCNMAASSCACWGYADTGLNTGAGRVHVNTTSSTCMCPTASDPSWN